MNFRENKGMISIIVIMAIFTLFSVVTLNTSKKIVESDNVIEDMDEIIEDMEEINENTENQQLIEIIKLKISEKKIELLNNDQRDITEDEIIDILDNYGTLIDDNKTLITDDGSEIDTEEFFDV